MTKTEKLIIALGLVALGVLFILLKDKFIGILMSVAGGSLVALGVVDICNRRVAQSVIKLVCGLLIVVCGWVLVEAVLYLLSGVLLVFGVLSIYDKIKHTRVCDSVWKTALSYSVFAVVTAIGLLLLFQSLLDVGVTLIICGVLMIIAGALILVESLIEE